MKRFAFILYSYATLFLQAPSASAEGFGILDFSTRGTSLAGGMVGRADDPSAVAHNPAGITQLEGTHFYMGTVFIMPKASVETRNVDTGAVTTTKAANKVYPIPNIYATFQLNDSTWLGLGLFSRFGLGIEYPATWPGRFGVIDTTLETLSLNPNIAFKLTDDLSLAVGVDLMYAKINLENTVANSTIALDADGADIGFNIALHYILNDQWKAGLNYRSAMTITMEGASSSTPSLLGLGGDINGELNLPDSLAFGLNYIPSSKWNFEIGFVHTLWSKYENFDIQLIDSNITLPNKKNWKDTWLFNISVENQALDWLALRAGYSFETSPIDETYADYLIPANGRSRLHAGVGFAWDEWKLDVGYSYVFLKDLDYSNSQTSGVGTNTSNIGVTSKNLSAQVVGLALTYKF